MFLIVIATTATILSYYPSTVMMSESRANLYQECGKLFHPPNYMDQLPSLNLPYLNNLKIPSHFGNNIVPIKPTPVKATKVINVVTKYVYRNPVCVKVKGKKSLCKIEASHKNNDLEYVVTKEYYVKDRKMQQPHQNWMELPMDSEESTESRMAEDDILEMYVQGSEEPRPFGRAPSKTPNLTPQQVQDMLIEDRLDQLETILPNYTRRRTYQTSTITVTKVRSNNRATATLLVRNCIPQGYDLCPVSTKNKKRKSKVAEFSNSTEEQHYFG